MVFGSEGLPPCFVDVAVTCPTSPVFASRAARNLQEKVYKYERAVSSQSRSADLRLCLGPLIWETHDFFQLKLLSGLDNMSHFVPLVRVTCPESCLGHFGGPRTLPLNVHPTGYPVGGKHLLLGGSAVKAFLDSLLFEPAWLTFRKDQ